MPRKNRFSQSHCGQCKLTPSYHRIDSKAYAMQPVTGKIVRTDQAPHAFVFAGR